MKNKWHETSFKSISEQADDDSISQKISSSVKNFEFFISELEDIITREELSKIPKRQILFPAALTFERSTFRILNAEKTSLIDYYKDNLSINDLLINISYNDLFQLYSSIWYNWEKYKAEKVIKGEHKEADSCDSSLDEIVTVDTSHQVLEENKDQNIELEKNPEAEIKFNDIYLKTGNIQLVSSSPKK